MPDEGPDGDSADAESVAIWYEIDLAEIANLGGAGGSEQGEGGERGRHPSSRRLLP
jgi:hypothetical protein